MVYDYMTTVFYSEYFSENRIVLLVFSVVSLRADWGANFLVGVFSIHKLW